MSRLDHIRQLADDLDVAVFVCHNCASPEWGLATLGTDGEPVVFLGASPNDGLEPWLTALHELGHHADPDWGKGYPLDQEAAAWEWALTEAAPLVDADDWPAVCAWAAAGLRAHARRDRRLRRTERFQHLLTYLDSSVLRGRP